MICKDTDISIHFTRDTAELKCGRCGLTLAMPSLLYQQNWGFPVSKENLSPAEWLHEIEKRLGRDKMMKTKVHFYDQVNQVRLGSSMIPFSSIEKLKIGDTISFKDVASVLGIFKICSFAVNQGAPEGSINLEPVKARGWIKLQEMNNEYIDSFFPF